MQITEALLLPVRDHYTATWVLHPGGEARYYLSVQHESTQLQETGSCSSNVRRLRVASKTVNKDKGRCFYCNEFGHFIKKCSKKTEDERSGRYSRMDSDYQQEGQYTDYDDTGLFTDDYDDEVFATLNS